MATKKKVKLNDKELDRSLELMKEARETSVAYRDMVARTCITIISTTLAILGFLAATHQQDLITQNTGTRISLYIIWLAFGATYLLSLATFKLYAMSINYHSSYIEHVLEKGDENEDAQFFKVLTSERLSLLYKLSRVSDALLIIGVCALVYFSAEFLHGLTR